ncbi:sulfatase-like hydrolase/transferase [Halobellus inordinatus]|uniref:sulfatase-like hydrolase/transferase n=1 Tax=Halobellus inordinatus TaxID=1126236 RepID=UPI0034E0D2DA
MPNTSPTRSTTTTAGSTPRASVADSSTPIIDADDDGGPSVKRRTADRIGEHSSTLKSLLETGYETTRQYWKSAIAFQVQYRAWRTSKSPDWRAEMLDRQTLEDAQEFLKSVDDPFCLFVHLNDAHYKYTPPNPFHSTYTNRSICGLVAGQRVRRP